MTRLLLLVLSLVLTATISTAQFSTCFQSVNTNNANSNAFDFSGVDEFGLGLLRNLTSQRSLSSSNLLLSPFSIWSTLSLALMGAQGNTKRQLENALGLPSSKLQAFRTKTVLDFVMKTSGLSSPDSPKLRSIDHAYFDRSLSLRECVTNVLFKLEVVDFADSTYTADLINNQVSQATAGEIPEFLKPSAIRNALFVLVNAIYFKGTWLNKFDPQLTSNEEFTAPDANGNLQTFTVPMMSRTGSFRIARSQVMQADILELPYTSSNISMYIILPTNAQTRIEDTLQNLTPFSFANARETMASIPVALKLPRFSLETEINTELKTALQNMGVSDMFNTRADFSDFTATNTFIDAAIHKAKVKVDEEGTVAAAATGLIATRIKTATFFANRPFAFFIYHKDTKVTLFSGVVRNPLQ